MKVLSQLEAGQRLAGAVSQVLEDTPLVIAITPGGAAVGAQVAEILGAPLDILTVVRLEVPGRLHSTFGAVADGTVVLMPERVRELGLPSDYVDSLTHLARCDAERITNARRGREQAMPLTHQTVVLVDDGSADATLALSAATALRKAGVDRLIFAAPQAGAGLARVLEDLASDLVVLDDLESDTQVRDPSFSHTTEFDIHVLLCRSRKSGSTLRVPASAI